MNTNTGMSTIEYRSHCKNCGVKLEKSIINNGRVYCSRKCRVEVMETNKRKGAKKRKASPHRREKSSVPSILSFA
jgi:uncharacterized Zn finger protein (UPF0148 family)